MGRFADAVSEPTHERVARRCLRMADNVACEIDALGAKPELIPVEVERQVGYGSVPGLEDEELADPEELERQVMIAEWGPILRLPVQSRRRVIRPTIDPEGKLDWGAFGTVDFQRMVGPFDKARYKADKLEEEVRHAVIMLETVAPRVSPARVGQLFEELRGDEAGPDDFSDEDERAFARWYLRIRRLRNEIRELREFSWEQWRQSQ